MKRRGTTLHFEAASSATNFISDPAGILIGLLIPDGGTEADISFEEVIGPWHNVAEEDLVVVTLTTKDGVTPETVHLPPTGGLIMFGTDATGAEHSPLPLKNFRLVVDIEQDDELDITPIFLE